MPVFTRKEFDAARLNLVSERVGQETHDHYFVRAELIDDRIRSVDKSNSFEFLNLTDQLSLIEALIRNDPRLAFNVSSRGLFPSLGDAPMNGALSVAGKMARLEDESNLPPRKSALLDI